jgi:hypothetical protein
LLEYLCVFGKGKCVKQFNGVFCGLIKIVSSIVAFLINQST